MLSQDRIPKEGTRDVLRLREERLNQLPFRQESVEGRWRGAISCDSILP
jgi:hypothetical protein